MSTESALMLTILCDNAAGRKGLAGKHGFSALVETGQRRVLFDTGPPGDQVLSTAATLGISLEELDAVVISHGHYDHLGGLEALLAATGPQRVVAHPLVFRRRFARDASGDLRHLGPPALKEDYERLGAHFVLTTEPMVIAEGLFVAGEVQSGGPSRVDDRLLAESAGATVPDNFADEVALVADLPCGAVVLTGCAHKGVANIVAHVKSLARSGTVSTVVGGLHLAGVDEAKVAILAEKLNSLGVRTIVPCHCTGRAAVQVLQQAFPGRLVAVGTGDILDLDTRGEVQIRPDAG